MPRPLQRKTRQQIIQLQLRRLPPIRPSRTASTMSGASSVSRNTRLTWVACTPFARAKSSSVA